MRVPLLAGHSRKCRWGVLNAARAPPKNVGGWIFAGDVSSFTFLFSPPLPTGLGGLKPPHFFYLLDSDATPKNN